MAAALLMLVATVFETPGMRHPAAPAKAKHAAGHHELVHHEHHGHADRGVARHAAVSHDGHGEPAIADAASDGAGASCLSCPLCLYLAASLPPQPLAATMPRPQSRENAPHTGDASPAVPPPRLPA